MSLRQTSEKRLHKRENVVSLSCQGSFRERENRKSDRKRDCVPSSKKETAKEPTELEVESW